MPRYKLRVPTSGDWLYGDGDRAVVADTREEAREHFEEYFGEPAPYLHSYIGRCRIVYKRDVEAGDCHEDAEPGDTTVDYRRDDGGDLAPADVRVWMLGPPPVDWRMETLPPEEITADSIPTGVSVHHRRIGSGKTTGPGYIVGRWWYLPVEFERFERGVRLPWKTLACKVSTIMVMPGRDWPQRKFRLTVAGEFVAEGTEDALRSLRDVRVARLNAEWEAAQDREMVA